MTICREWALVKATPSEARVKSLHCRTWTCDCCGEERRRQLMAQAMSGRPNRFITLTCNPRVGNSPSERLQLIAYAWRTYVKRLRREHPDEDIEYMCIAEPHLSGEPHVHILFRGPFIPQNALSAAFAELINSPIVDIRKVKDARFAARYVAKYVTKQPHQFDTCKRYWQSRHFQLPDEREPPVLPLPDVPWRVEMRSVQAVTLELTWQGYAGRQDGHGGLYFRLLGSSP